MSNLKLLQLKENLELTAFLVSKGVSEKEAHSKIIQSLILISELEETMSKETDSNTTFHEVNKVNSRLKLWAKRQHQANAKILNAFIELKQAGVKPVTERILENKVPNEIDFPSHFAQMKIIAQKNHGKIFEQYGENIEIWEPVVSHINEYEKVVFGGLVA